MCCINNIGMLLTAIIKIDNYIINTLLYVYTFEYSWNKYDNVRGIIPRSQYFSAPPVIVNVLPEPV